MEAVIFTSVALNIVFIYLCISLTYAFNNEKKSLKTKTEQFNKLYNAWFKRLTEEEKNFLRTRYLDKDKEGFEINFEEKIKSTEKQLLKD